MLKIFKRKTEPKILSGGQGVAKDVATQLAEFNRILGWRGAQISNMVECMQMSIKATETIVRKVDMRLAQLEQSFEALNGAFEKKNKILKDCATHLVERVHDPAKGNAKQKRPGKKK